jgi:hypothetical protein
MFTESKTSKTGSDDRKKMLKESESLLMQVKERSRQETRLFSLEGRRGEENKSDSLDFKNTKKVNHEH